MMPNHALTPLKIKILRFLKLSWNVVKQKLQREAVG